MPVIALAWPVKKQRTVPKAQSFDDPSTAGSPWQPPAVRTHQGKVKFAVAPAPVNTGKTVCLSAKPARLARMV